MKIRIRDRVHEIRLNRDRDMDAVTRRHTAFDSFAALLHADGGYRPSFYLDGKTRHAQRELLSLADAYNQSQRRRGDPRRVYAGDWAVVHRPEL